MAALADVVEKGADQEAAMVLLAAVVLVVDVEGRTRHLKQLGADMFVNSIVNLSIVVFGLSHFGIMDRCRVRLPMAVGRAGWAGESGARDSEVRRGR